MTIIKQVEKEHYEFLKYVHNRRFNSYFYQLKSIIELSPDSILEIWIWNWIIKKLLQWDYNYKSLDIDKKLKPDYIWSLPNTWLKNKKFDIVCAFQVLEHLKYSEFNKCLKELHRLSKKYVIISLPCSWIDLKFEIQLPFCKKIRFHHVFPKFYKKPIFDWEHYWWIGKKGYWLKRIKNDIKKIFYIKKYFIPYENTFHCFFVLEKQ